MRGSRGAHDARASWYDQIWRDLRARKKLGGTAPAPGAALAMTELYDHREDTAMFDLDVAEYDNVAAQNPEVVAEMRAALETYVVYC